MKNNNYKYPIMKTTCHAAIIAMWLLASCRGADSGFDATGVCGAVAAAALAEVLLAKLPSLSGEVASNGAYLTQRLNEVVAKHPDKAIEVRGRGFMQGIDLKVPPRDVIAECMKRGLLVCSAGYTVLRFVPPLIASREDIDKAASIVDEALSAI